MLVESVKVSIISLNHTLLFKTLKNHCFLLILPSLLMLLVISGIQNKSWYNVILILTIIIVLLGYYHQRNKIIFISSLIIISLIMLNYGMRKIYHHLYTDEISNTLIKIIDKKSVNDQYRYLIKTKYYKYYIYSKDSYKVGDRFLISGKLLENDTVHNKYSFNYQEYLENKGIKGTINISKIKYIDYRISVRFLNQLLNDYIDSHFKNTTKGYIKTLVIGNSEDLELDSFKKLGVSHLFVISGLHASIIALVIAFVLKIIKIPSKYHDIIVLIGLGLYVVICGFMISLIRVFLSSLLKMINKKFFFSFTTLDLFCFNILCVLLINPKIAFDYGFILSYLLSGSLILASTKLLKTKNQSKVKNYILSSLKTCLFSFLISLPIVSVLMNEINVLSVLFNLLYIPIVTFIIMPLSIVVFLIYPLGNLYEYIILNFDKISSFFSNITFCTFNVPKISIVMVLIYYVILILCFSDLEAKSKNKRKILNFIYLIIFLGIWLIKPTFNLKNQLTFFDLQLGESTLISTKYKRCNILIDTGDKDSYHDVTKYLINEGIKKLDYIFITHSDSDHIGELEYICSKIKVKNICFNKYDRIGLNFKKTNILYLKAGDRIKENNIIIDVLHPKKDMQDKNDNSLVLMLKIENKKCLFLGDIEKAGENELVSNYPNIKCDLVKIAHHGSLTSTTTHLLNAVDFKEAVIMHGHKNIWGFPNQITIEKLRNKKVKIYLTKELKTFTLKL